MEFKLKASSDLEIKNEIIQSLNSLNQNELMSFLLRLHLIVLYF